VESHFQALCWGFPIPSLITEMPDILDKRRGAALQLTIIYPMPREALMKQAGVVGRNVFASFGVR